MIIDPPLIAIAPSNASADFANDLRLSSIMTAPFSPTRQVYRKHLGYARISAKREYIVLGQYGFVVPRLDQEPIRDVTDEPMVIFTLDVIAVRPCTANDELDITARHIQHSDIPYSSPLISNL
jgi:hypothetical protein